MQKPLGTDSLPMIRKVQVDSYLLFLLLSYLIFLKHCKEDKQEHKYMLYNDNPINLRRYLLPPSGMEVHLYGTERRRRRWRRRYEDGNGDERNDGDDSIKSINTQLSERETRRQTHKYETLGVAFCLLSDQSISQNESIISRIKNKKIHVMNIIKKDNKTTMR